MGKIGDLIVRLKLQYRDYEKGLKDAEKKSKGFGTNLTKTLSAVKLGLAAIGTAAIFMGKELVKASNKIGDEWNAMVAGMKASWQSAMADIANYKPDFSSFRNFFKNEWKWIKNLFGNAKEAKEAGKEMAKAFDAEFELVNSLKIKRAGIKGQLAELQVEMMNTNLSPQARLAAAKAYEDLLTPLYEAEIRVRTNMLDKAVEAWLAGSGVSASVEQVKDFFANYGLTPAQTAAKHPELARIYETRKGDEANQPLFDAITNLLLAENGLADELKRVKRTVNSITGDIVEIERITEPLEKLAGIKGQAIAMSMPDIIPDDWLIRNREKIDEALAEAMRLQGITDEINRSFENAVVGSLSGATQAIADCIAGIEGADASRVLAALLEPFANTMIQLGEMLIIEGLGIEAFKDSLKTLQPAVALSAGAALLALGAALSAGIRSLGSTAGASAGASASSVSSSPVPNQDFNTEQTIYVKGKISGSDILIAGSNQQQKWNK